MKKITLLFALLISSIGFSQAPTSAAPTPPTRNSGDVMSLYTQTASSTVYSDITVANFNPNWGSTSGNVAFETLNGDKLMKYPNFHYQGIVIGQNLNLSAMEFVHVDVWTNSISPNIFLISATTGEKLVNIAAKPGEWTSIDIPLSSFTSQGLGINDIKELKFDGGNSTTEIYIDNLYFYKTFVDPAADATLSDIKVDGVTIAGFSAATLNYEFEVLTGGIVPTVTATTSQAGANAVITPAGSIPGNTTIVVTSQNSNVSKTYTISFKYELVPTDAPTTPPSFASQNVMSLYSEAYTPAATISNVPWDDSLFEEVTFAGNKVLKITGANFIGMDFSAHLNATSMTHLHMDYWIATNHSPGQVLNPKLSNHGNQSNETSAIVLTNIINSQAEVNNWQSKDFELNGARESIKQFLITQSGKAGVYYLDNVYMYVAGTASVENNLFNVSLYPNPANNKLNISAANTIQNAEIYNVLGKKVMNVTINKTSDSIDISTLASGVYMIKYNIENTIGTAKFIKQ